MTESAQCGRKIHMTADALRAVRNTALQKNGIAFELWVAMEALIEAPNVNRERLIGRLAELSVHDHASAAQAIDGLDAQGLITTSDQGTIELTTQGEALSENVIATRRELRNQLFGGIPSEDLATTNRVLDTIRQRAAAAHARQ
jgi:DNA-binding MarR family transcriptional regulator